ncbi:MAG TPA: adenylate/guanylate cyclase domain-containing protein [Candidatus Eisenbacteria bacterium]|nr:adenylate/guanylate cyclase domain-containing protein [Candidatus Eisenbacteria bacterium]
MTFLFTDIEGSTRILSRMGEGYAELLARHAEILRSAIVDHSGTEVATEGDSFFAAFASATDGVVAAIQAQQAFAAATWPKGAEIKVRMGLHTGEGRLGGDNYVGIDVNRAARIAAAGHGGQVLLSDSTRALIESTLPDGGRLRDLGEHRLKDFDRPMRISQLEIDGLPTDFPELKTLDARPGNLPDQLTSFVGRDRELAQVSELIGAHRLVTLTGPGGTGKTRLALRVAGDRIGHHRDGAFFVDLAPIHNPELVPSAIAQALRIGVEPGSDALGAVRAHLRDRDLLLILDNFEQVQAGAGVVEELLSAAPRVRVLVTSRMPLAIYGEQEYEVPPFEIPAARPAGELSGFGAVDLFVERARAVKPAFELSDDNAAAVAGIIAHLDGLPLAIELAAGQLRILSPSAILLRLEQHLPLPAAAFEGRPERQRTVHAAIDWSYELLDEPERRLFARLSAFPGGCSLEAAEWVADPGDLGIAVIDGLAGLVGKSLLRQQEAEDGATRFAMLETISEYAAERLRTDFDAGPTRRRLTEFYLAFAEEAGPHLTMRDQARWLDRCEREQPNLRAALRWAVDAPEPELGLRIATALWRFWHQRGPMWEGRQALDELLALPATSPAIRARALGGAGGLAWWTGDHPAMLRHHREALPLARESEDRRDLIEATYNLGFAMLWSAVLGGAPDADAAEDLFREGLAIAEGLGDRRGIAKAQRGLGLIIGIARGDPAAAVPILQASVSILEDVGDRWELTESLIGLGNGYRFSGDMPRARQHYLHALDINVDAGSRQTSASLLRMVAALESHAGRHERAARLWGAAEAARMIYGASLDPPAAARLLGDPVAASRPAIGDDAVDQALAQGRAMDLDAAIAYAHAEE